MRADLRLLVDDLVRDLAGRLTEAARDRALDLAIAQYGRDRPRELVSDCAAIAAVPDVAPAQITLPAGWDATSTVVSIEYPIGRQPRSLVPNTCWLPVSTPAGTILAMDAVVAGALYRLTWTAPYASEPGTTIPPRDNEAIAQYAGAVLLDQVAAMTSGDSEATIKADQVDQGRKAPNYAERAKTARQRYHDLLGIDPKRQIPASAIANPPLPATTQWGRLLFRRPYRG